MMSRLVEKALAIEPITNKGLSAQAQSMSAGEGFAFYFAMIWKVATILAGLTLVLYLLYGGIQWLTASGDKQKLEKAQSVIADALMGLVIVVAVYAIVAFIFPLLGLDLLTGIDWNSLGPQ